MFSRRMFHRKIESNFIFRCQDDVFFPPTTLRGVLEESESENAGSTTDATTSEKIENDDLRADGNLEKEKPEEKNETGEDSEQKKSPETDEMLRNKGNKETHKNLGEMMIKSSEELKNIHAIDKPRERVTTAEVLTRIKPEKAEMADTRKINRKRTCSPCKMKHTKLMTMKKEATEVSPTRKTMQNTEGSRSPVKLQALYNCSCPLDDTLFKGNHANCCKAMNMRTSTPRSDPDDHDEGTETTANSGKSVDQSYTYAYNVTNIKTDFEMTNRLPLMENLLKNNLKILKSLQMDDKEGQKDFVGDLSALELGKIKTDVEMEKEWNLFADQTNLEMLLRAAFPREDHEGNESSNTRIAHPFIDDSLKTEKMYDSIDPLV